MKPYIQFLSPLFFKYYIIILVILICIIIHYRIFRKSSRKIENFQSTSNDNKSENLEKSEEVDKVNEIRSKFVKEKQISENRKKEIDIQNKEIIDLEKESKNFEKNYNEEKELNNILVNSSNDNQLIENLVELLRRRQLSGAKISELENLNRLIKDKLEKSTDYTPDDNLFFQPTDLGNGLLNELQNEYNELIEKEKQESDKIISSMNKEYLEKENKKLLKYNKSMNDHYKYLKDEKNKLNLINLSQMVEDNLYSFIDDVNKSTNLENKSKNKFKNIPNIEGFSNNKSITIKERIKNIRDSVNKNEQKREKINSKNNFEVETDSSLSAEEENENVNFDLDNENEEDNNNIYISKKEDESEDLIVGFINYVFEILNKYVNNGSDNNANSSYITKFIINIKNILSIMFKEENLLASGLIFIVLSMCLFFIDISS